MQQIILVNQNHEKHLHLDFLFSRDREREKIL